MSDPNTMQVARHLAPRFAISTGLYFQKSQQRAGISHNRNQQFNELFILNGYNSLEARGPNDEIFPHISKPIIQKSRGRPPQTTHIGSPRVR